MYYYVLFWKMKASIYICTLITIVLYIKIYYINTHEATLTINNNILNN